MSPWQVDRVGDGALLVLVGLADVQEGHSAPCQQGFRLGRLDLSDGRLGLVQKVSGCGHDQPPVAAGPLTGSESLKRYQWGRHSHPRPRRSSLRGCETAAMELHDAIRRRAMVRSFSTEPVDRAHRRPAAPGRPALADRGQHRWDGLGGRCRARRRPRSTSTPPPTRTGGRTTATGSTGSSAHRSCCSPTPLRTSTCRGTPSRTRPRPGWARARTAGRFPTGTATRRSGSWPCCSAPWTPGWARASSARSGARRSLPTRLGVPPGWRLFCAVVVGHPDGRDHRSASLDRSRPQGADRVHHGQWCLGSAKVTHDV